MASILSPIASTGREIAVDDRVDQRIGEIVGLARPQAIGIAGLDALAHRVERIAGALLEGDDEILAEEDGDLLVAVERGVVDHAEHHEGMVLEQVDLRPLAGVDRVFQRQRVQAEDAADLGDQLDIGEADAIQPDQRPLLAGLLDVGQADVGEELAFLRRNAVRLSADWTALGSAISVPGEAPTGERRRIFALRIFLWRRLAGDRSHLRRFLIATELATVLVSLQKPASA